MSGQRTAGPREGASSGLVSRRAFLQRSLLLAAGGGTALRWAGETWATGAAGGVSATRARADAKVAIVPCRSYGPEVRAALARSFDLLGGIGSLVKDKTVTVKVNLTGTNFAQFLGRPVGETYMTHYTTVLALTGLLCEAELAGTLALADWDVKALEALGRIEFENTRNLGVSRSYAHLPVPTGGYMFSSLDLNHAYADTDVMVSLAKLKNHITAGVTLSMKNLFGLTPNSLYGTEAGREDATEGRFPLHDPHGFEKLKLPGLKAGINSADPGWRVPRITADICTARPIHLAIIDGITSMSGGEGPWCQDVGPLKFTNPGVLIAGLNPVSTDAVATAVMGYPNPRAPRGVPPFEMCDNHLVLAEQAGAGVADLGQIEVRGLTLATARYPYPRAS